MGVLKKKHKAYVVQLFACYFDPSEIQSKLLEEFPDTFAEKVPTSQLARYNPYCRAGASMSEEHRELFATTRQAFLSDRERIAIAQANFRLRELEELYRRAKLKNIVLAADLLKQAAQDEGNLFRRPERGDAATGDGSALDGAMQDGLEKVYGTPEADSGGENPDGAVAADAQPAATPGP